MFQRPGSASGPGAGIAGSWTATRAPRSPAGRGWALLEGTTNFLQPAEYGFIVLSSNPRIAKRRSTLPSDALRRVDTADGDPAADIDDVVDDDTRGESRERRTLRRLGSAPAPQRRRVDVNERSQFPCAQEVVVAGGVRVHDVGIAAQCGFRWVAQSPDLTGLIADPRPSAGGRRLEGSRRRLFYGAGRQAALGPVARVPQARSRSARARA